MWWMRTKKSMNINNCFIISVVWLYIIECFNCCKRFGIDDRGVEWRNNNVNSSTAVSTVRGFSTKGTGGKIFWNFKLQQLLQFSTNRDDPHYTPSECSSNTQSHHIHQDRNRNAKEKQQQQKLPRLASPTHDHNNSRNEYYSFWLRQCQNETQQLRQQFHPLTIRTANNEGRLHQQANRSKIDE